MAVIKSVEHFAALIAKELAEYSEEVEEVVEKTVRKVSKEALKAVWEKANTYHPNLEFTGEYITGFKIRQEYKARGRSKGWYKLYVTNDKYQLGHLLEHGHALRSGGRSRSFPHWVEGQKVADTLPDRIKAEIETFKGGG
jgi:hypothetical protein